MKIFIINLLLLTLLSGCALTPEQRAGWSQVGKNVVGAAAGIGLNWIQFQAMREREIKGLKK